MSDSPKLKQRLFITGANGWIGRRVVAAARSANAGVRALVVPGEPTRDLLKAGADVVQGDVRDRAAVAAFLAESEGATVIHLAGVIHPPDGRVQTFFDVNVCGTQNVVDGATAQGARRIVAMSSNSPFGGNATSEDVFDEASPYRPYMGYGRSKRRMEELLIERSGGPSAPEIVVVRAPWFYGPDQPLRQTRFFSMIRSGRFPIVGSGENRRSMAYVDNLAAGILLASSSPRAAGQTYWFADSRAYSMNEIVATVRTVLSEDFGLPVSARQLRVPGLLSDVARVADWGLQMAGLYQQEIHVLSEMNMTIACSVEKARIELGYSPSVELREGMRRSVQWCFAQGIAI